MAFGFVSAFGVMAMLDRAGLRRRAVAGASRRRRSRCSCCRCSRLCSAFVFRLIGWLLLVVLALPLMLVTFGLALAFGIAILHAALPVLLVVGIVWLIAHHHRGAQVAPPAR